MLRKIKIYTNYVQHICSKRIKDIILSSYRYAEKKEEREVDKRPKQTQAGGRMKTQARPKMNMESLKHRGGDQE